VSQLLMRPVARMALVAGMALCLLTRALLRLLS
jgi:hypothetical protein